ncbi:MAG: hypothetical protein FWG11_01600, partial [Promicromonosporaceae bacterium]|nr:hypothetical protein [Promicromonosporaceae bacterium]
TVYLDAGVVVHGPAVSVYKYSPIGADQTIVYPYGATPTPIQVRFRVQNIGNEPLEDFTGRDHTYDGPVVQWEGCEAVAPAPGDWVIPDPLHPLLPLEASLDDEPVERPIVTSLDALLAGVTLESGESVTCYGTLQMGLNEFHLNEVIVSGRGSHTQRLVTDQGPWQVTVEAPPAMLELPMVGGDQTWLAWVLFSTIAVAGALGALHHLKPKKPGGTS